MYLGEHEIKWELRWKWEMITKQIASNSLLPLAFYL